MACQADVLRTLLIDLSQPEAAAAEDGPIPQAHR